jgi:hypothetical protein
LAWLLKMAKSLQMTESLQMAKLGVNTERNENE